MRKINTILVIGAGVIGASWSTLFLAKGYKVLVYDIDVNVESKLQRSILNEWHMMSDLYQVSATPPFENLKFTNNLQHAAETCDFVQENGPENIALKHELYETLDKIFDQDVIISSSTSGLKMSDIQTACTRYPGRCVVGHPFNPPHLIPLVEIVGGALTTEETLKSANHFYESLGKQTVILHKEMPGHVANRLQSALWQEMVYLVSEGVVTLKDADKAITWGPGLRWGVMGPTLLFHLGGGEKGLEGFLEKYASSHTAWWQTMGQPELNANLQAKLIDGIKEEVDGRSMLSLENERDEMLVKLINLRSNFKGC